MGATAGEIAAGRLGAAVGRGVGLLRQKKGGRSGSLSQNYPKLTGEYLPQKQYPPQELSQKFRYSAAQDPQTVCYTVRVDLGTSAPIAL
jgi:hypothetical protein